jgi:hypothetical protein
MSSRWLRGDFRPLVRTEVSILLLLHRVFEPGECGEDALAMLALEKWQSGTGSLSSCVHAWGAGGVIP